METDVIAAIFCMLAVMIVNAVVGLRLTSLLRSLQADVWRLHELLPFGGVYQAGPPLVAGDYPYMEQVAQAALNAAGGE